MIEIVPLVVGPLQVNCYIIHCLESNEAVIVDPGAEGGRIVESIRERSARPILILNTHGHGDHIGANGYLKEVFSIPLAIHQLEIHLLTDPEANFSQFWSEDIISPPADFVFTEGDQFNLGRHSLTVLFTPGHSPGGCSFLLDQQVFTGDALFKMSIGRTDLPGCSHKLLLQGIREKLLTLPDDTEVYPGHGPKTTIGDERRNNPFLQEFSQ